MKYRCWVSLLEKRSQGTGNSQSYGGGVDHYFTFSICDTEPKTELEKLLPFMDLNDRFMYFMTVVIVA